MNVDFDAPTLAELRARSSAKWTAYPPDVLPAWVAEMDVMPAPAITAALEAALARGDTGYVNARIAPPAFARFVRRRYDWSVDPNWILSAPDVLVALAEVLRVVTPPDAPVVINPPVYPPFSRVIPEAGRRIAAVPLRRGDGWELDFDGLERAFAAGAKAYVLCTPHNPLGLVFGAADLERVIHLARAYGVVVIADEIHAPLVYREATHTPFIALAERLGFDDAVGLWSASKAWNLAGLKYATIVAGSDAMRSRLRALPAELPYRAGHFGALATVAAYDDGGDWLDALIAHLDRNRALLRDLLAQRLPAIRYELPCATYLAWLDCSALGIAGEPVDTFLERGRVALSRGSDFGPEGRSCVRLNFGTTAAVLSEVVERMVRALDERPRCRP